jgi:hypothetical protein
MMIPIHAWWAKFVARSIYTRGVSPFACFGAAEPGLSIGVIQHRTTQMARERRKWTTEEDGLLRAAVQRGACPGPQRYRREWSWLTEM